MLSFRRASTAACMLLCSAVSSCVPAVEIFAADPAIIVSDSSIDGAKQPRVAVDNSGTVFIAFGAGQDIYVCQSVDATNSYSKPKRVAQVPGLALGMRRGPRIVAGNGWVVVTAISHKSGELLSWRSDDKGESWSEAETVNDAEASAREGLHAMAVGPDGLIVVVWLDHRNQGQQIFGSSSRDGGLTWKPNQKIYASPSGTVCECCHPSVCIGRNREIYVMWRNSLSGDRDMYLTRSDDGGQTFLDASKLGTGSWSLNACPMDGGDLAVNQDGSITTVWRREKTLFTTRDGKANESMLATGEQPCIAIGPESGYLAWVEKRHGALKLLKLGSNTVTVLDERAADPSIGISQARGKPIVVVWESTGKSGQSIVAATVDQ